MKESNRIKHLLVDMKPQDFPSYEEYCTAYDALNQQYRTIRRNELDANKARAASKAGASFVHIGVGASHERNDCVPVALALVLNISYDEANRRCKIIGRRTNCGTPHLAQRYAELGLRQPVSNHRWDIGPAELRYSGDFVEMLPQLAEGRYLCSTGTHAFAVINGVIHDTKPGLKRSVHNIYVACAAA